jgi:hypothetical protein
MMKMLSHKTEKPRLNPFLEREEVPIEKNPIENPQPTSFKKPTFKTFYNMFFKAIPPQMLFDVLEQVCVKREEYYIFNMLAFRSLQYRNLYPEFASKILPYYRPHYQEFVTRPLSYSSFVVILRHICRMNNIRFDTKANYGAPCYNIDYYVYY